MGKIIVVLGKSSSGKTTLAKLISKKLDVKNLVTNTSREKRLNEVEGVDYYFKTKEEFEDKIKNNEMIEYAEFNNWYYGLEKKELFKHINQMKIVVLNPQGYRNLIEYVPSEDIIPIYVECEDSVRLIRSLDRNDDPKEVCRRYFTDMEDFKGIRELVNINGGLIIDSTYKSSYNTFCVAKKHLKQYL